jgi:S-adenosylmethionine synthetase
MGRKTQEVVKVFNKGKKSEKKVKVKLFPWEELNAVAQVKKAFGIK